MSTPMLLTTIAFVLLTAALVWLHLRSRAKQEALRGQTVQRCPRCGAAVPDAASVCKGCGVPLSAYEVVAAKIASPDEPAAAPGAHPHAIVRADICVGCGTCVAACPEPGAMRLENKLALVDLARCVGHGKCAEACPTGAIVITTGAAVHRVEAPDLDAHFQTNLSGVYIVGELGGRGLIKNAINEGKIAIEHIAGEKERGVLGANGEADTLDVVIVGSGPAGLSAGLEAARRGLSYVVLEQGTIADTIRKYPRRKLLLAEPVRLPLYGDLWVADASKETLIEVWDVIVRRTGLDVREGRRVDGIVRAGATWVVSSQGAEFRGRRVVLAMGRRGTPRRLGAPGEELSKVIYDVIEMEQFAERRVLVVGGGDSALESALGASIQPGARVTLAHRGSSFDKAKDRNREKLAAAVRAGKIDVLLDAAVKEIGPSSVTLVVGGQVRVIDNDDVIVRVGGEPPQPFLQRIGVRLVKKDIPLVHAEV